MNEGSRIVQTDDGSDTVYSEVFREHYHSVFGAITESSYIFIAQGLQQKLADPQFSGCHSKINILEIGFGTGLNCILTLFATRNLPFHVNYTALEPYPLEETSWKSLQFTNLLSDPHEHSLFRKLHLAEVGARESITAQFFLKKDKVKAEEFIPEDHPYHIIYFDAFSPAVQPELWTEEIFRKMFRSLDPGGILVTYCVKGMVVRAMKSAGFLTQKLPGPPGKRHILRAKKPE